MSNYINEVCDRCGSKKRVSNIRKEVLETYTGSSVIEISEIICTNKTCQESFEVKLEEEAVKRAELKKKKDEGDRIRKENILARIKEKRKASEQK